MRLECREDIIPYKYDWTIRLERIILAKNELNKKTFQVTLNKIDFISPNL